MRNVVFPILAVILTLGASPRAGTEELVSYQLNEAERLEIIPDGSDPISRPLRQVRYAQPYAGSPHEEREAALTLTGLEEPLTQQYLEQYASRWGRNWLNTILKRSEPYLAFIRREIDRRGLPQELIYLPVIESAYSTGAVSRSGATGLWQFMRNSIGPYDMKITEWLDERKDFWKSTVGALDKLETEYKRVGSWELALSAYNAGLGTVLNAMKKYPGADYWELCRRKVFKKETIHYIPRLIAVSYILSNPRRYGIEPTWPEDPQWTRLPVDRPVDLAMVAEYAGLSGAALKQANGELYYGITPPDLTYLIKVPSSQAGAVESVLKDPDLTLIKYYIHLIRSGETLSGIARTYGVPESQIRSHNPGLRDKYLKIGQRLIIPALGEAKTGPAPAGDTLSFTGKHLVKRGETLWSIALAYNTSPETLARINGMALNDTLKAGTTLKTPVQQ
ncbi:MAG: LysM peptidoglycan-binding domain-containing protein [Treponema sp.]|jgi:membrane-bound lytic murein transglycosylase D|nr:LysM peptidoglycan-binding domain-containing protein [Treponema sp.]